MSVLGPPTFESLIDGPPDAHTLIAKIDELARALFVIRNLAVNSIIWDENYAIPLHRIENIAREALGEEDE